MKNIIIKVLLVVMVILLGIGIGYLFSNRNNIAEYNYPELETEEVDYGESLIDNSLQPTPNIKVDEKVKQKELTDNLTSVTYKEFKNLFKSPEKVMVVIVKDNCPFCARFEPVLEEVLTELNLKMYLLNTTDMTVEEKQDLANYVYLGGTPTTYVIYEGNVLASIEGSKSKDIISSFIELFYLR